MHGELDLIAFEHAQGVPDLQGQSELVLPAELGAGVELLVRVQDGDQVV